MRILVFSDVHSSNRTIEMAIDDINTYSPELLLISGDITHFGPSSFANAFLDAIDIRTLAIPGNCDPPDVLSVLKERGVDLHEKRETIEGFDFVGFGGSNTTPFDTIMEFDEEVIFASLDNIMVEESVLVTHVPPKGFVDATPNGIHAGSRAVKEIVEKYRPRLSVSGHIHEARGLNEEGGTVFLNPGSARMGFRAIVELTMDDVGVKLLG
jgi:Icc-related predicted phosphoesterase